MLRATQNKTQLKLREKNGNCKRASIQLKTFSVFTPKCWSTHDVNSMLHMYFVWVEKPRHDLLTRFGFFVDGLCLKMLFFATRMLKTLRTN